MSSRTACCAASGTLSIIGFLSRLLRLTKRCCVNTVARFFPAWCRRGHSEGFVSRETSLLRFEASLLPVTSNSLLVA